METQKPAAMLLTLRDAEQLLGIEKQAIKRLIKQGALPGFLLGGKYRIDRQDLLNYLDILKHGKAS